MVEKAYRNLEFLSGRDARVLRILSEYLEPQARFQRYRIKDTVVFFGSARALPEDRARDLMRDAERDGNPRAMDDARRALRLARYYEAARTLAHRMTDWSKGLAQPARRFIVCSGGGPGIMEAANRGASEAAGLSIGLGISLPGEPAANPYITRELAFEFHYFFMRKFWFVYLAKALVVFPGGFGTMDELFELLTLVQTQKAQKPMPIVLYGREYWDEVANFDAMARWGTVSESDLRLFRVCDEVDETFNHLRDRLSELYLDAENGTSP